MKVGDLVRAPAAGSHPHYPIPTAGLHRYEWEGKVGIIVGIDNRQDSEGFMEVLINSTGNIYVFSPRTLEKL